MNCWKRTGTGLETNSGAGQMKKFKGGENMSEQEKKTAKEVIDSLKQIPPDGADYVRGYLQGRLDGLKKEKEDKE